MSINCQNKNLWFEIWKFEINTECQWFDKQDTSIDNYFLSIVMEVYFIELGEFPQKGASKEKID